MIGRYIERRVAAALEERATGYTSLLLAGLEATADGKAGNFLATGAVEIAAGAWGRALASARIEGDGGALTPRIRHRIGRDLIREGESVFLIETRPALHLVPASSFDVREGWRYQVEIPEPPGSIARRNVARDGVFHVQWAQDPLQPWRGLGPLQSASLLASAVTKASTKLDEDLQAPVAHLVPVPADGGDTALDGLRSDIANAKGGAVLAEAPSTGWDEGPARGTRHDWRAERLGPEPPEGLRDAWDKLCVAVGLACGIPADLIRADADGTSQREAYRRFVMMSVQPVADMIAATASDALDGAVTFDFRGLWAHDVQGRASALHRLVEAGLPLAEARAAVGM